MFDQYRVFYDLLSKIVQWIKPAPPSVGQCIVFVPVALAIFYGGMVFSEYSAKEKLMVQEGAAAEARAEREEQEKKLVQKREEREMKLAQEREEQEKKLAKEQEEMLVEDPAKLAKERAAANAMGQNMDAVQESQEYDVPPGSDGTQQTYTDPRGVIWQRKEYTDSRGLIRVRYEPQLPKEVPW